MVQKSMSKFHIDREIKSVVPKGEGNRIMILGDLPFEADILSGEIFSMSGGEGYILRGMLKQAGIKFDDCHISNVFLKKSPDNNPQHHFIKKLAAKRLKKDTGWTSKYTVGQKGFLREEYESEIERVASEVRAAKPNVIIALGATALWALTGFDKIGTYRGTVMTTGDWIDEDRQYKVVGTYHPFAIRKAWDNKPIAVADLVKARLQSKTVGLSQIEREIWLRPTLRDLNEFYDMYIKPMRGTDLPLSCDIETAFDTITCLGFGVSPTLSIVIPFHSKEEGKGGSYWPNPLMELYVWEWVKKILEDDQLRKLYHNGMYDISWLSFKMDIKSHGIVEDSMLISHSLQPELKKSLGILGSIYSDIGTWKNMTSFSKSTKKDA